MASVVRILGLGVRGEGPRIRLAWRGTYVRFRRLIGLGLELVFVFTRVTFDIYILSCVATCNSLNYITRF